MATLTLTVPSAAVTGQNLTATVTYNISSTNSKTTFSIPAQGVTFIKTVSAGIQIRLTVGDKSTIVLTYTNSSGPNGSALPSGYSCTWDRTTSSQSKVLKLEILEGNAVYNPSTGNVDFTGSSRGSKTETITIPVLPSYTVTYNANGRGTAPSNQTKYYGVNLSLRAAISATGYNFVRWNTSSNNTGTGYAAGGTYTANSAVTLYAIWSRTVTFNPNGGYGAPNAQTGVASSSLTLSNAIPVRDGYRFKYWCTNSSGIGGTVYNPGGTYAANNPNMDLYAIWEKAISSVFIGKVTAIRTENSSSTTEADEGEYAYLQIPYTVSGEASSHISIEMTVSPNTAVVTLDHSSADKPETGTVFADTVVARASNCAVDSKYVFTFTITASNTVTGTTQSNVVAVRSIVLASAYFVLDIKAGGKGIHFGGAAVSDGLWVSMPSNFNDALIHHGAISSRIDAESLSSNTILASYVRKDSEGLNAFYSETIRTTSNQTYTSFIHQRYEATGSNSSRHGFYLRINNDGSLITDFPSAASRNAWIDGLNVVKKDGDTMTGNLTIKRASGSVDTGFYFQRTDTEIQGFVGVGSGGTNHGIWSDKQSRWLMHGDASNVYVAGVNYTSQAANKVLASPNGSTGAASFRALVSSDIPSLSTSKITDGTFDTARIPNLNTSKLTAGILGIARGGTGTTTGIKGWFSILSSVTDTTVRTIDVSAYTDIAICVYQGTAYRSGCLIPKIFLATSLCEFYLGGWGNNSTSSKRRAYCKISTTQFQAGAVTIDGNGDVVGTWYLYGR